jgi:hypothetical protein
MTIKNLARGCHTEHGFLTGSQVPVRFAPGMSLRAMGRILERSASVGARARRRIVAHAVLA